MKNKHHSERLLFRALAATDADKLFDIYSDKEAMKYRGSKVMTTLEDAKKFIRDQRLEKENTITIRKGIERYTGNELIGSVMYKFYKYNKSECEIGYSIGKAYWGQGLGRAIVKALVADLKVQGQIKTIKAWSKKENLASIRILELNDFVEIEQQEFKDAVLYIKRLT